MASETSYLQKQKFTRMVILVGTLALIAGMSAAYFLSRHSQTVELAPSLGGDFTLQSLTGELSLADFKGKIVPIYFGYTFCPDACPTSLTRLGAAMKQLDEAAQLQIQPLFISVDPERDNVERLAEYAAYFHPQMLGLTGDRAELDAVTRKFGAIYRLHKQAEDDRDYLVDHSSRIYIMGRDNKLAALLGVDATVDDIARELKRLLDAS